MEIKYADNVTLTVEITDQMVKDFKRCQEMAENLSYFFNVLASVKFFFAHALLPRKTPLLPRGVHRLLF